MVGNDLETEWEGNLRCIIVSSYKDGLKREENSKDKKLKVFGQDNTLLSAHHSKIRNPFVFD